MSHTRLYRIWNSVINRCKYKSSSNYKWYGEKGIKVCEEWERFENFYKWAINNGYDDTLSIDRIDSKGNYTPSNCRWATMKEQQNNRSNNVFLTYKGETYSIAKWAEITGISIRMLYDRRSRGWDVSRMLEQPKGKKVKKKKQEV